MNSRIRKSKTPYVLGSLVCVALVASGCSGVSGSSTSSGGTSISGSVTTSNSGSGSKISSRSRSLFERVFGANFSTGAQSNCDVKAYEINGTAVIATSKTDSSGKFTMTDNDLKANGLYKLKAECGTTTMTSLATASASTSEAESNSQTVNPVSTLIAAQVISAITSAVSSAITAAGVSNGAVATAIANSILTDTIIAQIAASVTTAIESAIESGAIQPPTSDSATGMAAAVNTAIDTANAATSSATANTAVTTAAAAYATEESGGSAATLPDSVSSVVSNASQAAASFPGCDSATGGSQSACVKAVANLMFGVLHFPVGILKTAGAFGETNNCTTVDGTTDINTVFKNAKITSGTGANGIPAGYCAIENALPSVDRNYSASNNYGDHGDHGPVFAESGVGITMGALTEMAAALYTDSGSSNTPEAYTFAKLDQIVFGFLTGGTATTTGGMNARLINVSESFTAANGSSYTYKLLKVTNSSTVLDDTFTWPTCNSSPCHPGSNETFGTFADATWDTASLNQPLATAIKNSAFAGSVFLKKFGGQVPSQADLTNEIVNSMVHKGYNRTGQKMFYVLYSKQPDWQNHFCQWNNTNTTAYTVPATGQTTTECTAMDGTAQPAVTVNLTFGTKDSKGVSNIATITKPATGSGAYYIYPMMNGQFGGILQFIKASNGAALRDEALNLRYVRVITDAATQCGGGAGQISDAGCADGKMYNIKGSWPTDCNSNCQLQVSYTAALGGEINPGVNTAYYSVPVQYHVNMVWSSNGPGLVGVANSDPSLNMGYNSYKTLNVTVGGDGAITGATAVSGAISAGYAMVQNWNCTSANTPCTQNGYYLVDSSNQPYTNAGALAGGLTTATVNGNIANTVIYNDTYMASLGSSLLPYADTGTGSWKYVAQQAMLNSGPATNPGYDCTLDPFFVDSGDHTIHFTTNSVGFNTCSTVTFGNSWDVSNYISGGNGQTAHPNAVIGKNNKNAYEFGDPTAVLALLNTAFGSWMGTKTLDANSELNALQGFSLIYLLLSGDNVRHIDGILADQSQNNFMITSPMFSGDGNVVTINAAIGGGFKNMHK